MTSLKTCIQGMAKLLGTTPPSLYERQKVLVSEGLLTIEGGRGPGSGVRATVSTISQLLLAVLASDGLGECGRRVTALRRAKPLGSKLCPFTKQLRFIEALETMLDSKAERVISLTVSRTADRATIEYRDMSDGSAKTVEFVGRSETEPGLSVAAKLDGDTLRQIAQFPQAAVSREIIQ